MSKKKKNILRENMTRFGTLNIDTRSGFVSEQDQFEKDFTDSGMDPLEIRYEYARDFGTAVQIYSHLLEQIILDINANSELAEVAAKFVYGPARELMDKATKDPDSVSIEEIKNAWAKFKGK